MVTLNATAILKKRLTNIYRFICSVVHGTLNTMDVELLFSQCEHTLMEHNFA